MFIDTVNLFIIYDGVKHTKLTVNWIKAKFYRHLVVIKSLCLVGSVFVSSHLPPIQEKYMQCPRKPESMMGSGKN